MRTDVAVLAAMTAVLLTCGCDSSSSGVEDLAVPSDMAMRHKSDAMDASVVLTVDGGVTGSYQYLGSAPEAGVDLTVTIDHDTNRITVGSADPSSAFTISGPFQTLASGFLKITFTDGCNGAGCVPAPGTLSILGSTVALPEAAHAMESPGVLAVVLIDQQALPIVGVAQTDCGTAMLGSYNLIDLLPVSTDAWAQVTLGGSATNVTAASNEFALNGDAGTASSASGPCASGVIQFGGGAGMTGGQSIYQSGGSGVLFVSSPGDPVSLASFGLMQSAIALSDLDNKRYLTLSFDVTGVSAPVYGAMQIGPSSTGVMKPFADPDSDTVDVDGSDWSTFSLEGMASGLITASLTVDTQTWAAQGAALQVGNVNVMAMTSGAPMNRGKTTTIMVQH
jgi:hypothetical protein